MRRKRRTEILLKGSKGISSALAKEILAKYEAVTLEEPNDGLVMLKIRESAKKSLFYIGEVLVTECKVRIKDSVGIGLIAGHEEELAYYLAVIDAAYKAGLKETEGWKEILVNEEKRIEKERIARVKQVLKTKVNFETMDTEKRA